MWTKKLSVCLERAYWSLFGADEEQDSRDTVIIDNSLGLDESNVIERDFLAELMRVLLWINLMELGASVEQSNGSEGFSSFDYYNWSLTKQNTLDAKPL